MKNAVAPFLATLKSRDGTYAILGNHDTFNIFTRYTIQDVLGSINIQVLWNEIAHPWGSELYLIGLADLKSGDCCPHPILATIPSSCPRIVLAHNPYTAELLQHYRVDLQLSGHTHGGQIIFPGLGSLPEFASRTLPFLPSWLRQQIPYFNLSSTKNEVLKERLRVYAQSTEF